MIRPPILLLLAASGVQGGVAVYTPIEPMFAESGAVVVASCVSVERKDPSAPVERDGHLVPLDYIATYTTIKIYKGAKVPPSFRVFYPVPDPAEGVPGCGKEPVLLFVISRGSGAPYALANSAFGSRSFPGRPLQRAPGLTPLEELATDAASFLSAGGSRAETALRLLDDFGYLSEAGTDAVASFTGPLEHDAAVLRLEILVRAGRPEYFEKLLREIRGYPEAGTPIGLCEALEKGGTAKDLPALEELARSAPANSLTRGCADRGIRNLTRR